LIDPSLDAPTLSPALRELALALGDDCYLLGHRDAEWTGLGPILEEDIAFSSMAQDEMGHALVWYQIANAHGAADPDTLAYLRPASEWRNARFFELPRGDYATSMARQFLADLAQAVRYDALSQSSSAELSAAATKLRQEERYHLIHGRTTVERLAAGTTESRERMQRAFDELFPYALGIWEPTSGEELLVAAHVSPPSQTMGAAWLDSTCEILTAAGLEVAAERAEGRWSATVASVNGGRTGEHGTDLDQILAAAGTLRSADPEAVW
jgi:ring-1,2-phenylacetyl-CoA epoxidase subunit PaaC